MTDFSATPPNRSPPSKMAPIQIYNLGPLKRMQNLSEGGSELWFQSYRDFSFLLIATVRGLKKILKN